MSSTFVISKKLYTWAIPKKKIITPEWFVILFALVSGALATIYSFHAGFIVAYGDAESHLNIAKRVVDSITPGFAQLGGIWLPFPHILIIPFVYSDFLWRTGLAGSIVSGTAFVISALYIYKLVKLLTKNTAASILAALVFMTNPNVLYMQSTPMTELTLIVFFVLSTYYFILFLNNQKIILNLLFAAFFGFCASLSRYDGWALVLVEAGILFLIYFPYHLTWTKYLPRITRKTRTPLSILYSRLEGRLVLYSTLAFFGILLSFMWGYLILGDPLYFTHSQFSAKSQQSSWLSRGELPAYRDIFVSFQYYFVTAMQNAGVLIWSMALCGCLLFLRTKTQLHRWYIFLILSVPFVFNVATLYLGQSIIFIPSLTPTTFEWTLFNVRYGVMMLPCVAVLVGYLFYQSKVFGKTLIIGLMLMQLCLYGIGYSRVMTLDDGVVGLSSFIAKIPDAQLWLNKNYDHGTVLLDDYARAISIIRTPVPMNKIIYVGNKPYWEDSLTQPEKYADWIIMQKHDTLWTKIYEDPVVQGRLYKYFNKAYTSEEILIFERNRAIPAE